MDYIKRIQCVTILIFLAAVNAFGNSPNTRLIRLYIESDSGYFNVNTLSGSDQFDSAYAILKEFKNTIIEYKKIHGKKISHEKLASAEFLYSLAETRYLSWKYVNRNGSSDIDEWKFEKLDSAITLAKKALDNYLNLGYNRLEPEYYITIGVIHEYHNPKKAYENYKQTILLATKLKNEPFIAKAHEYIGSMNYFGLSRHVSITHLKASFNIYSRLGNLPRVRKLGALLGRLKNNLTPKERLYYYSECLNASRKLDKLEEDYFVFESIAKLIADEIKPVECTKAIAYLDSAISFCMPKDELTAMTYSMMSRKAIILKNCGRLNTQYRILLEIYNYGIILKDSGYISKAALLLAEHFKEQISNSSINIDSALYYYTISNSMCPNYTTIAMYDNGFLLEGLPIEYVDEVLMKADSLAPLKYFSHKHSKYVCGELVKLFLVKKDFAKSKAFFQKYTISVDSLLNAMFKSKVAFRDPLKVEKLTAEIQTQDNIIDVERDYQKKLKLLNWVLGALAAIVVISFIFNVRYFKRLKKALIDVNKAQNLAFKSDLKNYEEKLFRISLEHQIKILRLQINPHFIFNALNSIYNCILSKDNLTAAQSLTKFSRLMRRILQSSEKTLCSLSEELVTLELYTELEKMRFDREFQFRLNIATEINPDTIYIPPLLIQPFIENCIWHGLIPSQRPGVITLNVTAKEQYLLISIEDNGVGRDVSRAKGNSKGHESVGVSLTTDRIRYFNEGLPIETPLKIIDLFDSFGQPSGTRVELILKRQNSIT